LRLAVIAAILLAMSVRASGAQASQAAPRPIPQPVPFSHKPHCMANVPCVLCHQTANTGETAGLPSAAVCMTCHQSVDANNPAIRKVAAYAKQNKPIPWIRIYKIQDFVFFSHKRHTDAKVACSACHGQVCERDVLAREVNLSMMFCIKCHKAEKAPAECNTCHTLSM
jgi:Cytochrome c7 and related cytochrome c